VSLSISAISAIKQDTESDIIGRFGFKSGRDFDKLDGLKIKEGQTGVPIVLDDCLAYFECKIVQSFDVGTHIMYIGEVIQAELLEDEEPITYAFYRQVRKGLAPKNAPTYIDKSKLEKDQEPESTSVKYKCPVCGYIYDPDSGDPKNGIEPGTAFEDLPNSWACPVCGCEKEDFEQL